MKANAFMPACLSFILFQTAMFAGPLDNWHWRNPLPNGNPPSLPHNFHGITFANGTFVAAGDGGVVSTSTDTTNWTESATATANTLNAITYTYSNGLLVAVGDGGVVEYSSDGTNWALGASATTNSLKAVAYGNGVWVAVGAGGVIITSTNVVNWTPQVSGTTGNFIGVTHGSAGFLAINQDVTGQIFDRVYFSSTGVIWTNHTLDAPGTGFGGEPTIHDIVTFANGVYLIGSRRAATSESYNLYIFTSTDGNSWTTNLVENIGTFASGLSYQYFMAGNGIVIAAAWIVQQGSPFFLISTNTTAWTTVYNVPTVNEQGNAGAFGNGTYAVVASSYMGSLPPILTSSDALNWTNRQHAPAPAIGPTNTFTSIAFNNGMDVVATSGSMVTSSNDAVYTVASNTPSLLSVATLGSGFIGVGLGGAIYQSGDGLSWTQRNSSTANNLRGVTVGNGLLVAVGDNGAIQTSPSGTVWTSRTSGTSLPLYAIAYSNGLFVAVGQLGTVLTSPDGISWSGQYSGQLSNLLSVVYGSAGFVATGPGGTIVTSTDGTNWIQQNSGAISTLESVAFGNGYYLATGDGALALTSPDGITWASRNIGATGGQNLYGCAFLNNRFDVVGAGGTVIESDTIPALFDVQIHLQSGTNWLTVFAPSGSNFHIQTCTNLAKPVWEDAASYLDASPITQWTNGTIGTGQCYYRAVSP
jgi:hypothetical protein